MNCEKLLTGHNIFLAWRETPEIIHSSVLLSPTLNIIDFDTDATWSSS